MSPRAVSKTTKRLSWIVSALFVIGAAFAFRQGERLHSIELLSLGVAFFFVLGIRKTT
jgi:hypothetical protein